MTYYNNLTKELNFNNIDYSGAWYGHYLSTQLEDLQGITSLDELESNFKKDFPGQRITTLQELQSQREKPKGGVKAGILGVIPILEWAGSYYDTGPKGIKRGGIIKNKQVSLKDQMNRLT